MSDVIKISDNVYVANATVLGLSNWLATHVIVGSDGLLIIDPGPNICVDVLINILSQHFNLSMIKGIALTHIHLDHGGGTGLLLNSLSKLGLSSIKVYTHPRGVKHLSNPERLWSASKEVLGKLALTLGEPLPIASDVLIGLEDGDLINLGNVSVKAIHTPGHASHHIAYLVEPDNILIAGDALGNIFEGRVYPVSVPPFDLVEYLRSLSKLARRKYNAISVAHFGYVKDSGDALIQRFRDKIIAWTSIIAGFILSGVKDPEEVFRKLLKVDLELEYMVKYREIHELVSGSAYRSVLGVYQYLYNALQNNGVKLNDLLSMLYQT